MQPLRPRRTRKPRAPQSAGRVSGREQRAIATIHNFLMPLAGPWLSVPFSENRRATSASVRHREAVLLANDLRAAAEYALLPLHASALSGAISLPQYAACVREMLRAAVVYNEHCLREQKELGLSKCAVSEAHAILARVAAQGVRDRIARWAESAAPGKRRKRKHQHKQREVEVEVVGTSAGRSTVVVAIVDIDSDSEDEAVQDFGVCIGGAAMPHGRPSCAKHPFETTAHSLRCPGCWCCVCEQNAAECRSWDVHCHTAGQAAGRATQRVALC